MPNVSLVFFSGNGATALLADAILSGARGGGGVEVNAVRIEGTQIDAGRWSDQASLAILNASDTIVFGTPTYMGGPSAQFKAFADATGGLWRDQM